MCLCFIGVCICRWRCRGWWWFSWQRSRGGHAWLLRSYSDCHHHKSGPAVDGATHPHLLCSTRAEWHRYDNNDPVGGPGPIRHARDELLLRLGLHPSQLGHPRSLAPVTKPPAHTGRNGKLGSCAGLNGLYTSRLRFYPLSCAYVYAVQVLKILPSLFPADPRGGREEACQEGEKQTGCR